MGHDEKIHKEHYHLPTSAVQTSQLSKLFLTMDKGEINKYGGKLLNEMQVCIR